MNTNLQSWITLHENRHNHELVEILEKSREAWLDYDEIEKLFEHVEVLPKSKHLAVREPLNGFFRFVTHAYSEDYGWDPVPGQKRKNCVSTPVKHNIGMTEACKIFDNGDSFERRTYHHRFQDLHKHALVHYRVKILPRFRRVGDTGEFERVVASGEAVPGGEAVHGAELIKEAVPGAELIKEAVPGAELIKEDTEEIKLVSAAEEIKLVSAAEEIKLVSAAEEIKLVSAAEDCEENSKKEGSSIFQLAKGKRTIFIDSDSSSDGSNQEDTVKLEDPAENTKKPK